MTEYRQTIEVDLTHGERYLLSILAVRRNCLRLAEGAKNRNNLKDDRDTWGYAINGLNAEGALAKALDVYLDDPVGRAHAGDIGRIWKIEVRQTDHEPDGKLRVKPEDKDESPFVLALGRATRLHWVFPGWLYGKEAKQDPNDYYSLGRDKAFWIRQHKLRPMGELELILARKRFEWLTSLQSSNIILGRFDQGSRPPSAG